LVFGKWEIFGIKKYWQNFWKTVMFGNICQFWHYLATGVATLI